MEPKTSKEYEAEALELYREADYSNASIEWDKWVLAKANVMATLAVAAAVREAAAPPYVGPKSVEQLNREA